ncbi:tetratricopeptide repeat protein [Streptomyces sp. NPDC052676]|uniref:tetratricopeptide repeat protein n=1 Tax=Streptomyces sp. NPDC052676 TaxID=3154953 RepID=UPI003427D16B
MTGRPCVRPDCPGGHIMATGFCDTCLRRPLAPKPPPQAPRPETPPRGESANGRESGGRRPSAPGTGELDRDGLPVLPYLPSPEPSEAADTTARPPTGGRRCGVDNCPGVIGVSYDGGPAPDHGFCPECGAPYSFRPQLHPGDVVGGHYKVLGYLAVGGHGWIYLAEDTRVPDLHVVLKGLINTGDAVARRAAVEERRSLTTLHHPDIVRIITHVDHQAPGDTEPTGYIVMEYVGGRSLAWLRYAPDEELTRLLGGPLEFGHVITYGCMILGALEYLHGQGLLYCDMKPDNVIHYGRRVKVLDLGAIRPIGDRASALTYTHGFAPSRKELEERGFHVDSDLYTVGRTLKSLADRATEPVGLAARSFEKVIHRATHPDPAARFTSAAEMSRQLWEVLREHQALGGHEPYPERSTRFQPTAAVFGGGLGAVPALDHFTRRPGSGQPHLPVGAPHPRETAAALPVPIPDPADPATLLLDGLAADTPDRIAERARRDTRLHTVEAALWLCRAYLDAGEADHAAQWVRTAKERGGDYDWRVFWHQGLVHLVRGDVERAEGEFAATYAALPGETAPKLALGYCAEYLSERLREAAWPDGAVVVDAGATPGRLRRGERQQVRRAEDRERQAEEFYEAVRRRDPTQGSAAFGLARIHLRGGRRRRAVAVLDEVPTTARHHDAARVAAIRALAGRLPDGTGPGTADLGEAAERLAGLRLDGAGSREQSARDRLTTELREYALVCRPPGGWGDGFPTGALFGPADTPQALRALLSRSLKRLADQAGTPDERGDLLDRAYAVLPEPARLRELLRVRRRTA